MSNIPKREGNRESSSNPLISVVIPNYNYAHFLPETLDSVIQQSYQNIEVIVVDDGSTDNSREVISEYAKRDPRVKLICKSNGGLSSARNEGIRNCNGDYIAFLDSDDLWNRRKLEDQNKELLRSGSDIVFSDYQFYKKGEFVDHPFIKVKENYSILDFIGSNPVLGSASSIIIRKDAVEMTGFFDERLTSVEDLDYWFRLASNGFKFSFLNEKHVYLRLHNVSMVNNANKMFINHISVFRKQMLFMKSDSLKVDQSRLDLEVGNRLTRIKWYLIESKNIKNLSTYLTTIIQFKGYLEAIVRHPYIYKLFVKWFFGYGER